MRKLNQCDMLLVSGGECTSLEENGKVYFTCNGPNVIDDMDFVRNFRKETGKAVKMFWEKNEDGAITRFVWSADAIASPKSPE